jgi:hypothetical protein
VSPETLTEANRYGKLKINPQRGSPFLRCLQQEQDAILTEVIADEHDECPCKTLRTDILVHVDFDVVG